MPQVRLECQMESFVLRNKVHSTSQGPAGVLHICIGHRPHVNILLNQVQQLQLDLWDPCAKQLLTRSAATLPAAALVQTGPVKLAISLFRKRK